MDKNLYIIAAAGGNITAIQVLAVPKTKAEYENLGRDLINNNQAQQVEQAGFLIVSDNHFEMSGGEFCGNAARAVAILFAQIKKQHQVEFTMSGFPGLVQGQVKDLGQNKFFVQCRFPNMPLKIKALSLNQPATLVDLGGIVHVVMETEFPSKSYESEHRQVVKTLGLENREAVGVIWTSRVGSEVKIDPVVWVKGVDSFFYESSCGSGSIAAARVLSASRIIQPTGQMIEVLIESNDVILKSEMEVKDAGN